MTSTIKFTKSVLAGLIKSGEACAVKDADCNGLKFVIGKKRNRFVFEKRISGRKGAAITVTIGAYPAIGIDEARIEGNRLANLCERGIDPRKPKATRSVQGVVIFGDALDCFFEAKKDEIASETMRHYRYLARFIPKDWLELDLNTIKPGMIAKLFHEIKKKTRTKSWEFIKFYGNIYKTCSAFFLDENGERILKTNPIPEVQSLVSGVKRDPKERPVIPANQLGRFVVTLEKVRDGEISLPGASYSASRAKHCNFSLLALFIGFRYKELQWLKWDYIDLEMGTIALPGMSRRNDADFKTKNRQDHMIPLASYPLELLQSMYSHRDPASPYVFYSETNPLKPAARCKELFLKLSDYLGFRFTPHAARRTFASIADDLGLGFLTVKRMLNHHFEGGVTGGYVVKSFNPLKQKGNFQKVCDYILHSRAVYLGQDPETGSDQSPATALEELSRVAAAFGLDPKKVLELLADVA